jgi:hypothetical protein
LVVKVARSDEAEIENITTYTNSQNQVRAQDFLALRSNFRRWASEMADYGVFLEVQRGAWAAQKAYQQQHHGETQFKECANAFDLIKVYGAGWMGEPGTAFGKNAPFLPLPPGKVYEAMTEREGGEAAFGVRDLYAAYKVDCAARSIVFGKSAESPSRRQSRFLFYHVIIQMLRNVILITPQLQQPSVPPNALTDAVLKLSTPGAEEQFELLTNAAVGVIDQYMTAGSDGSVQHEKALLETHNGDLGAFLKSEQFGKDGSPLLAQALAIHNAAFNMAGGRAKIAQVLLAE